MRVLIDARKGYEYNAGNVTRRREANARRK